MAAVVSHAMRRFPTTPPDTSYSSYSFRGESSRVEGESALSRSMRYADPWLYGSVRAPGGFFFTPAFVLCACPDYINGTKKSSKKSPSQCKKCKGARLPLSSVEPKYGTVRYYPTEVLPTSSTPIRGGTVRVTSSKRPSILPSPDDPYDLVRKSRLSISENNGSFRARSVSPSKTTEGDHKSRNGKSKAEKRMESYNLTIGRRSILECDINPYELVSSEHPGSKENDSSNDITLVNGQRIRVRSSIADNDYEDVQLRLSTPAKSNPKSPSKLSLKGISKSSSPVTKERKIVNESDTPKLRAKSDSVSFRTREKELNQRFKSILKKSSERSPSPTELSSSQFYIPLPNLKKKVQFLVSNDSINQDNSEDVTEKEYASDDDDVFQDSPRTSESKVEILKYEEEIPVPENTRPRKIVNLYRSLSDRIKKSETKNLFHDTMAIRHLKQRTGLKIDFSDLERLDGINRKIKKLCSKPNTSVADENSNPKTDTAEILVKNEDLSLNNLNNLIQAEELEIISTTDSLTETTEAETTSNDSITSFSSEILENTKTEVDPVAKVGYISEKPNEELALAKLDQCISVGKLEQTPAAKEIPPSAPPRKRSNNKQPLLTNSIRIEAVNKEPTNKTVVKINTPPAVHKIQIKTEFSDSLNNQCYSILENAQRKTSIMINGDDCYSTVNVNDDIPLYQSSVVVKDSVGIIPLSEKPEKKCSTVYITGSFISCHNTISEKEKPNTKENEIEKSVDKDSEMLRELLKDPVEAVRRNLVPHVCGKSDVLRRQRDKKFLNGKLPHLPSESLPETTYEDIYMKPKHYESICDDLSSEHSSSTQYELIDPGSDCYTDHSNRSSVTEEELANRTKFYELLADSGVIEVTENDDHIYESIKINSDPIYEDIEIPPPLPSVPPPSNILDDINLDKEFTTRSIFEGASKYDILSYLVDAKERGLVQEDGYTYFPTNGTTEDDIPASQMSTVSDSSEDNSLVLSGATIDEKLMNQKGAEVERNDSGVGSETSKSSLSKYRSKQEIFALCEDCETTLEGVNGTASLLCRKCVKKRSERKEIITEIVETEEKYSKDLQIILEEFYQPMLVAGLLTPDQLSAIFLNVEELLENSQALAERLRDAVEIALEQGDEDLLTVNTGKLFLEAMPMLHAFETYCVRQGSASLLLASLEKEKELLRIFLRVSQMENTMLRRMNLNSFLMVPVQRVTKYPLLLVRLYKVTPPHYDNKEELKEAQHKIELHLNHMNSQTKDVPSKLWRRIGSSSGRRSSTEMDLVNIKLRKIAVDVLEWNHEEAKFALEGRLLFTQPTDNNWRKGRTIKLTPINAMLVINGKPTTKSSERSEDAGSLVFSKTGVREAALLLVRDKNGRYSLLRDPLYLDRCVIAADPAWQSYFEVQELLGKDTFIFKAEDEEQTSMWYKQLQYHAQGMGAWRKRRNALANIMINGMGLRS